MFFLENFEIIFRKAETMGNSANLTARRPLIVLMGPVLLRLT
jgi:hypothetical protein